MPPPSPREQGTGWFIVGTGVTVALIALVIWLLAFRYDVPLY